MQGPKVAAEREELGAGLAGLDVAVEPVGGQVLAGQQLPDPVGPVVGRTSTASPRRVLLTDHHGRVTGSWLASAVGDGVRRRADAHGDAQQPL